MAAITRFDPFTELRALQQQFLGDDRFFRSPLRSIPTTDVYTDDDKELVVEVHLPNFTNDEIDLELDEGDLIIRANHNERNESNEKQRKYVVRESASSFYRRIRLPENADQTHIDAAFHKGVLKVTVPFAEVPQPTKIAITGGQHSAEQPEHVEQAAQAQAKEQQPVGA